MKLGEAIQELETIRERLAGIGVLEDSAHAAIGDALRDLQAQKKKHISPWNYRIRRERPLAFRRTDPRIVKHRMSVDVFADISQPENGVPLKGQSITVRVWCHEMSLWYNPHLDSPAVKERVERRGNGRVMHRFHFDYDNPDEDHPWFHLQIGGQQTANELHRMPHNLARPRFLHHPMNLLMVCEFIVRHFYPDAFQTLATEPSWHIGLRRAQGAYLGRYLAHHAAYDPDSGGSFLTYMWQIP